MVVDFVRSESEAKHGSLFRSKSLHESLACEPSGDIGFVLIAELCEWSLRRVLARRMLVSSIVALNSSCYELLLEIYVENPLERPEDCSWQLGLSARRFFSCFEEPSLSLLRNR